MKPYFGLRSYTDTCRICLDIRHDGLDPAEVLPGYEEHVRTRHHYGGQIGSEATPQEWVAALVECTREWVRVLKPSGSMFVNLGDKYSGNETGGALTAPGPGLSNPMGMQRHARTRPRYSSGLRPKSLLGLPWRYALACTDQLGLILRRDIIWAKPNGLPESVTDRCRSSHEYLFHLVKQPRYYAAVDEIREPHPGTAHMPAHATTVNSRKTEYARSGIAERFLNPLGKLPGSVWNIPSQPLQVPARLGVDHFAAFPMELPRRCVLGWSPPGICVACGEGRRPVSVSTITGDRGGRQFNPASGNIGVLGKERIYRVTGYACACPTPDAPTRPAVILDPFGGTGTTALIATVHGRHGISIDRSADYTRLARWRTTDPGERARALQVPKPPPVPDGMEPLFDLG